MSSGNRDLDIRMHLFLAGTAISCSSYSQLLFRPYSV